MNINKLENNNFHLIMSGSGARFISFVGSLSYYQNYYDNFLNRIKTITATSGGSIVGLLIALGYNLLTIKNYILNLESKDVKKSDYFKFLHSYGIDDGEKIINIIKNLIEKKLGNKNATFKDLYMLKGILFNVTGTCLNTYKTTYFSYESHPDMELWKAVRISTSIPFYYTYFDYEDKVYVDGALLEYFPISKIEDIKEKGYINNNDIIIAIKLSDVNDNLDFRKINNIKDYGLHVIYCILQNLEKEKNLDIYQKYFNLHFFENVNSNDINSDKNENKQINIKYITNFHFIKILTKVSGINLEIDKNGKEILFSDSYDITKRYMDKKDKYLVKINNVK